MSFGFTHKNIGRPHKILSPLAATETRPYRQSSTDSVRSMDKLPLNTLVKYIQYQSLHIDLQNQELCIIMQMTPHT